MTDSLCFYPPLSLQRGESEKIKNQEPTRIERTLNGLAQHD